LYAVSKNGGAYPWKAVRYPSVNVNLAPVGNCDIQNLAPPSGNSRSMPAQVRYQCPNGSYQDSTFGAVFHLCKLTAEDQNRVVPAVEDDFATKLDAQFAAQQAAMKSIKERLDAIALANPGSPPPLDVSTAPLTVSAPPVTGPSTVVSTRTIPNADGSTSTQTVTEQTKVTPVVGSPSTVGNPNVSYPTTTITTTTTVNNVTNKTEIVTDTKNNPGNQAKPADIKIPDDYNREVTQKAILAAVSGEGMPEATMDTKQEESDLDKANKDGVAAVGAISEGSIGITNWFPKIETSACRNPQVPNPIGGAMVDVVICDKVDMFSAFISGVIAVFCLFGCVREVTVAVKA
jgi:hypothetical protein